jgi:hypothetical protein
VGEAVAVATIGDRLRELRAATFTGRAAELELFASALDGPEPAFSVLYVHGPGGVGKTSLRRELARLAEDRSVDVISIDLRAVPPTATAFEEACRLELGATGAAALHEVLDDDHRRVLLVDSLERAPTLETWLRDELLPRLPARTVAVLLSRNRPADQWRADEGWRSLLRVISLRNLEPAEALTYLDHHRLPKTERDRALQLTHGHPLALSLWVDVMSRRPERTSVPRALEDVPDLVTALLERFLDEVPSPRHRAALGVLAQARVTNEALLADVLADVIDDAPDLDARGLFAWLHRLSFVDDHPHGVVPHDLARDVLDADLRRRDPVLHLDLHRRIRTHLLGAVEWCAEPVPQQAVADVVFLHRASSAAKRFLDLSELGSSWPERLAPEEHRAVLDMLEAHQGAEQASHAERWMARQPDAFVALRGDDGELLGAAAFLHLQRADPTDLRADPGTAAMWEHATRHAPPRPGEEVTAVRLYVDREHGQSFASRAFNALNMHHTVHMLGQRRRAWQYIGALLDHEDLDTLFGYIGFDRLVEHAYEVGGHRYALFARDWRRQGLSAWLEVQAQRELGEPGPVQDLRQPPLLVLSQVEFAAAVREALRDLHRPAGLAASPLLRSRLTHDEDPDPGPDTLRELLLAAVAAVGEDPRQERPHRALERTFVRPAATQELAAEVLGLPFSTYRRHLARGIEAVATWLWERELHGPEGIR